ncbi:MAG: signal peptidase I [Candidatus Gastranaerophilales bacterium]|nr:signal peptidase I [Candidatus Gastranaerophilales bacterium]
MSFKKFFTKQKIKAAIKETIETVVTVLIMVAVIRFFIGEPRLIPSGSMHPTLIEGDRLFIERVTHFIKKPDRFDIIVFYPPTEELEQTPWAWFTRLTGLFNTDIAYIKRIVGVGGDKIEIKQDDSDKTRVYLNGKALDEPYILDGEMPTCTSQMNCSVTVPEGEYFVMGDNRANSYDSRYWGYVPENRIVGRAVFRFWPVWRITPIENPLKTDNSDNGLMELFSKLNQK